MRWRSAPASTSSAARRRDLGVVFVYWKRPVSVTSAIYNASAMSGVSWTSSSRNTSRSSSPVDEACASMTLTSPKRVLSWWWWMFRTSGACWRTSGSGPSRDSFAQSTARSTLSAASPGSLRTSPSSGMKPYSAGSGVSPARNICEPLPSCRSARSIASIEPSASPSGFSCVVTRKRSPPRITSAACASSVSIVVVWGEFIDQQGHSDPPLDRRIVFEGQLRRPLHPEFLCELRLQDSVCRLEALQALLTLPLGAEHRDEDLGVPEVGRRLDPGDGDETDPRVLQPQERPPEDFLDGVVDPAHSLIHLRMIARGLGAMVECEARTQGAFVSCGYGRD